MKYSFASLQENIITRKFGGTTGPVGVANPYVSGQFFIWFEVLPDNLMAYLVEPSHNTGFTEIGQVKNVLSAACLSVTPPGGTLNSIEFTGLGGIKWNYPGNIEYATSVSVKFLEFSKTPILHIFHSWIKMIRDYRTGISEMLKDDDDGTGYTKSTFGGTMYYWTTAPDGINVEYYACYDGVFPTKDPQDLYSGDVETVGRLDVEQEFKFDYMWHEPWVKAKCVEFAKKFTTARDTVNTNYNYI